LVLSQSGTISSCPTLHRPTLVRSPVGNTGPALAQIEEAKKICERCSVKEPCLAWALESGQDAGVWGGLSEDERRAMKRRAARNRARQLENQNTF